MPVITPDTWAQIYANAGVGAVAVLGSIGGAVWGAKVGAKATEEATTAAIAAERETAHEQRLHEDRTLIRALIIEYRPNAKLLREKRLYQPDPRHQVQLRTSALDRATGALAGLPEDIQQDVALKLGEVLWFNQLVIGRVSQIDDKGGSISQAFTSETIEVGNVLPRRLDRMAGALGQAISTTVE